MSLGMIVAYDDARGIGKDGGMPWKHVLKEDLEFFKSMTYRETVIMGRKTWESLPKPLKGRRNIIISSNDLELKDEWKEGGWCSRFLSLDMAIDDVMSKNQIGTIIGGGTIYQQALTMPIVSSIIVTNVFGCYDCDTFFPTLTGCWEREDIERTEFCDRFLLRRKK